MTFKNEKAKEDWLEIVKINSIDDFSKLVIELIEKWANLMEKEAKPFKDIVIGTWDQIKLEYLLPIGDDIGFIMVFALTYLMHVWHKGDEIKEWLKVECDVNLEDK